MWKKKEKSEIYYIKVWTFRRTLELRVGWTKEEFDSWKTWFDYNLTTWMYWFDEENNCNIIWLKDYSLSTLVHELVHCVEWITDQVWLEMKWEPIAFIFEELFTKIMIECIDKFKLEWDVQDFYEN